MIRERKRYAGRPFRWLATLMLSAIGTTSLAAPAPAANVEPLILVCTGYMPVYGEDGRPKNADAPSGRGLTRWS